MATRRALVIGGSLGGLLAANLLRHAGWDVTVFERNAEDLTGRGAGISTHPQLIDILRRVGIDFDESMGIRVDTVICLDKSGKTYLETKTARTMAIGGGETCAELLRPQRREHRQQRLPMGPHAAVAVHHLVENARQRSIARQQRRDIVLRRLAVAPPGHLAIRHESGA